MERASSAFGFHVPRSTFRIPSEMKIIVAIKQVPARDSPLRVDDSGRWILENDLTFEVNEPDAYALEEALQLKEKHGGEVIALCAGPGRAGQTIREALAKGADRAIHIEEENLSSWDALGVARLLAAAVASENADLVLTGLQSDDLGAGQTGVVLAELLGLPHATIIMQVEKLDGSVRVKRELEDGWFQHVEIPLPAVLTIQSGISRLPKAGWKIWRLAPRNRRRTFLPRGYRSWMTPTTISISSPRHDVRETARSVPSVAFVR